MKKTLALLLCSAFLPSLASAAMNGQILNCDTPNPTYPSNCVDNWALDLLDESKSAIEAAKAAGSKLPRDRKHYFNGDGTGVHIFILDTGVYDANPEFKKLDAPSTPRTGAKYREYLHRDRDGGSHGTRVAGIAAGVKFGIAKDATLHPIISNGDIGLDAVDGPALLDRLDWVKKQVTEYGAKPAVLNMSFNLSTVGLDATKEANRQALTAKVKELIGLGVVVVASAGNKNDNPTRYWPSEIPEVIVVGGVDDYGRRWIRDSETGLCTTYGDCGSNYGSAVDLWAPAKAIRSAIDPSFNTDPLIRSGTSYAAPIVTGLAALHLEANPTATPAAVLNALRLNAANLGDIDGNLTVDYLVRSPVATPACNVPQRLFTNGATATSAATAVKFTTIDLADSCPSGTTASSPTMPSHGQLSIAGIAPEGVSYLYTPSGTYTGPDAFNYTITPSTHGTGTVKVIVQPPVN